MSTERYLDDLEAGLVANEEMPTQDAARFQIRTGSDLLLIDDDWIFKMKVIEVGKDFVVGNLGSRVYVYIFGSHVLVKLTHVASPTSKRKTKLRSFRSWLADLPPATFLVVTTSGQMRCDRLDTSGHSELLVVEEEHQLGRALIPYSKLRCIEVLALPNSDCA